VVALVRGACLGLAEALDLLDPAAELVLRDALDLPGSEALRGLAEKPDYLAHLVAQACAGRLDPRELPGLATVLPPSQRELARLRSRHSTSGASTARRRP